MPKYIIEHMEPELFKWSVLEYKHISEIVGKENLIFTNIETGREKLENLGEIHAEPVEKLDLKNTCLLDPNAATKLTPKEAEEFDYFVFGGILGDSPPKARTKDLVFRLPKAKTRNLGKEQMSTDTAVLATKMIAEGKALEEIEFQKGIEMLIKPGESILLPYQYILINKIPVITPGLREMLKKQKGF